MVGTRRAVQADVLFVLRCCLTVTFLGAAVGKLRNRRGIVAVIGELLPIVDRHRAAGVVALGGLVALETALGLGFVIGVRLRLVALAATASLVPFTWALLRLRKAEWGQGCACFGVSDTATRIGWVHIARNLVLAGASGAAVLLSGRPLAEPLWRQADAHLLATALAVGVAAALAYGLVEGLWQVSALRRVEPADAMTPEST
ncbi:MauE/DoxX family redox-associated membrane protein [Candidatus Palauibacter sp.]|uniref:MauE/DoxX family redox-associated membrane protein n=1 Tax=Candidatus Palauibacter sp. TaxID=3101350 RepID=UPI003AF2785C